MGAQANTFNVIDYGAAGNGQADDSIVCILVLNCSWIYKGFVYLLCPGLTCATN